MEVGLVIFDFEDLLSKLNFFLDVEVIKVFIDDLILILNIVVKENDD